MTDSRGSLDSPQEAGGEDRKSYISEDPNSNAHLEALFEVIHTGHKGAKPMHERQLPPSFFKAPHEGLLHAGLKHRLGPSISVGHPLGSRSDHLRSMSLPATIDHSHGRQYSLDSAMGNMQLPPGWELAKTPDGLSYFIDHNSRTTSWEDPRKTLMARQARTSIPHQLQQQTMAPQYPQPQLQPMPPQHGQQASVDAMPLPEGWQRAYTQEGEVYYVNHKNRTTSWLHPNMAGHHQHSHSFAGPSMSGGIGGHPPYAPHYSRHQQQQPQAGLSLQQHLQAEKDMLRKHQYQMQRHEAMTALNGGGESKQVPTTMYGDPYLSGGGDHVRQTSHDSGLGGGTMPGYPSDFPTMDLDEGMDTQASVGIRAATSTVAHGLGGAHGPRSRTIDYLESMQSTDVDVGMQEHHTGMETDQPFPGVMGGADILDFGKDVGGWV